jgi:hypothetical protein
MKRGISGLREAVAPFCFVLLLLLSSLASPSRGEDAGPLRAEADTEQSDVFYDAMLNSIELDRNRWKSFSRSMESGPWFYDTQGLVRNDRKVTAQVTVYPHPNRTELYASVYGDHGKIRKIVFVTEIDCSRQSYRQPEIRAYGYYRELLSEHVVQGKELAFSPIRPGTTTDTLRTLICTPGPRKKK